MKRDPSILTSSYAADMDEHALPRKLWEHPAPKTTAMYRFWKALEHHVGNGNSTTFETFDQLFNYSIDHRSDFWRFAFQYFPLVYSLPPTGLPNPVVDESARIESVPRWFDGVQMNFAQSILFQGDGTGRAVKGAGKADRKIACTQVREGSDLEPIAHVTWGDLRSRVGRLANAMRAHGVKKGDRVAVVAGTCIDTLTVFLAVTSLGGMFSSSSTDMGVKGILDRLLQIKPKYLFMDDAAVYNGKEIDLRPNMIEVVQGMAGVAEFKGVVAQSRFPGSQADIAGVPRAQAWHSFLASATSDRLQFEMVDFNDPFLIVYSSGTTGQPKCIVHRVGGIVLNGHKEARLHRELNEESSQLQYTTTGWIMYLASVQTLLTGARIIMYDGSPFVPQPENFIHLLGREKVTSLGISPRYLQTLQSQNLVPKEIADLSSLQTVTSTGVVLSDALFEWFYDVGFPPTVHLDNISGGTDLAAAFGTGNPVLPVYIGGCQSFSLGYTVSVYEQNLDGVKGVKGVPVEDGVPGELVCLKAFPSMPIMFWGDRSGQWYFDSYFARFDNAWTHGDFIMVHPNSQQVIFLGRADGVLNPSGVRFGSAEIYSVIESHFSDKVADSICVGQRRPQDADESVMLFLLMKRGHKFTPSLVKQVREAIRKETSPRHVPRYIFETPDIPVSASKKLESGGSMTERP